MATGRSIGTVYAEIDLDSSRYLRSQKQLLKDATSTSLSIEQNFKNLGVRSSAEFDLMRARVENAYNGIKNSAKATENDLVRAAQARATQLKAIDEQQYGRQLSFMEKVRSNAVSTAVAITAAYSAFSGGRAVIDAALTMERIYTSMKAVSGSAAVAARDIQFLREESQRLGLDFASTAQEFAKFSAATKNTSMEGEASRKVFSGFSEAITALKLNSQDASLIFMAMTQMVSKGKVSMEELRKQMGERLPGALRLAAEGMGMSTAELNKNVEAGKVMASDLLPALAEQLHKTYGSAAAEASQSGQAAINRMNNAMFETKAVIGGAVMPTFVDMVNLIASGAPYAQAFVGGLKMAFIDLYAAVDHAAVSMRIYWAILTGADAGTMSGLYKQQEAIEQNAEAAKKDAYDSVSRMNFVSQTEKELLEERLRNEERRRREAASVAAATAKASADKREQTEKQLDGEIRRIINGRKRDDETYYQFKARQIEGDLEKYIAAEANKGKVDELRKQKLLDVEKEVREGYRKSMSAWDDATLKKIEGPSGEEVTKTTQEQLTAYSTLYSGIVARSQQAYDVQEALIYEQGNKFYEVTKDEVAVAQWEAEQLEKLYIERAKYSTDWRDGMKAGFLEIQRDATTWGGAMQSLTKSTFTNMSSTFSTVFYDVITGKFEDIGDAFEKLGEGMLKNFTEILGKIAAEKIVMYFETQWAKEGAGVLGVLSKLMGISLNAGSGGSTVTTTVDYTDMVQVEATGGMWTGGRVPFGDGGAVGGWPRYPGNHPGNDTVPAWLSPGEVVIRRTSVNPDTAQILDYINKTGQNPGFYNGGSVAGMVTDQPGRGYWGWDDFASIFSGGLYDLFQGDMPFTQAYSSTAGNFLSQILFPGSFSQTLAAINKYMTTEGGTWESLAAAIDRWIDPGGVVDWSTRTSGEQMPESLRAIAPQVGAIIGSLIYPGYGTAAGYGIGAKIQGQAYRQSFQGAGISLAASQVSSSVNDYITGVTGDKLAGKAAGLIAGNLMRMGIGAVAAATVTDAIISSNMKAEFTGFGDTKGIANSLSDLAGMVGKDYAVSARDGLSYVPRDNYRISAHEGEAVLTKEEAREWRAGKSGGDVHLHFHVAGDLLDKDGFARTMVPAIKKAIKAGAH